MEKEKVEEKGRERLGSAGTVAREVCSRRQTPPCRRRQGGACMALCGGEGGRLYGGGKRSYPPRPSSAGVASNGGTSTRRLSCRKAACVGSSSSLLYCTQESPLSSRSRKKSRRVRNRGRKRRREKHQLAGSRGCVPANKSAQVPERLTLARRRCHWTGAGKAICKIRGPRSAWSLVPSGLLRYAVSPIWTCCLSCAQKRCESGSGCGPAHLLRCSSWPSRRGRLRENKSDGKMCID